MFQGLSDEAGDIEPAECGVRSGARPAGVVEAVQVGDRCSSVFGERRHEGLERAIRRAVVEPWLGPWPVRVILAGNLVEPWLPDLDFDGDQVTDDLRRSPLIWR